MEEEVGIKVTRLRRRLSVEADDVKSPSTPTKKRGGRLAAKPQLELIDENAPEAAPKRTRKSTVKEVAEPVEEKVVTPARRSARVRSNTSIVSETPGDVIEDKSTPSRRSTRIKSNTSLIAEPVNVNSPRAKRAARRLSQVGSDNEAPITPVKQTRRTRKDSTSSIDKPVEQASKLGSDIKEVIVEESENVKETKSTERSQNNSPSLRKSPRLFRKSDGKSSSLDNDNKENEPRSGKEASETSAASADQVSEPKAEELIEEKKASEQINLSATSKNLIQSLEEAPKKAKNIFNKSTTAIQEPQIKTKRNRTKSWTTISVASPNETSFCSDSETTKKRNRKNTLNFSNISGSGDGNMKVSSQNEDANNELENVSLNSSTLSNKKKKKKHEMSLSVATETSVHEVMAGNTSVNKNISEVKEVINEEKNCLNSSKQHDSSVTQKLFQKDPSGVVQSLVFIEDSDSNHETVEKENNDKSFDSGDQCVPVVDHQLKQDETTKNLQSNLSYEPMDIDETMPENVSLSNFIDKNDSLRRNEKELAPENRKSMVNISEGKNDTINKSKRKSSMSNMTSDDIDLGSNKSSRKSSISEIINEEGDNNKSKRKSSISNAASGDTTDGIFNVSTHKSLVIDKENHDESINKKSNKSKRKSSISNITEPSTDEDSNNSARKSLNIDKTNDESTIKESNKSKRKSSISNIVSDENTNEISNKSTRKSSGSSLAVDENLDNSINKSKRKSTVNAMVVEISMDKIKSSALDDSDDHDNKANKSTNKSKRKSSITDMPNNDSLERTSDKSINKSALHLDNSDNDNKSTLVLSQLKDVSENEVNSESNVAKDCNDSNQKLTKSESVTNVTTEKDTDRNNISLTYSTSTPLQQKAMKKLGLQINSSIIAPSSDNKNEKKVTANKLKKGSSVMLEENCSEEDEDVENDSEEGVEEDSEEESESKLIDVEADEAGDDYESGDSRDEEEIEYEKQNEIKDKGETLDSDEAEFSDDSDYEKDSFIVSSDEEENDLLSGSGDDLSLSVEELTMSAKSKEKFNERKIKEQKKASREMYEARHKLNESDKRAKSPNSKSKKNNRQRFDSSSSESDEEVVAQPKKKGRQRIDSSHDASTLQSDADQTLSKKKKTKRLSESECDENEIEITINNENQTENMDPLTLNVIKEEPKTPQKEQNISNVGVTNMDEVEEVNVDENLSIIKANQTSDPLQATIAENDDGDSSDEGSISENEEITQNYESILQHLNKSGSKKIKSSNISLDLNKKTKQKSKEPIVDQLNLTQVKKSKKKKADVTESAVDTKELNKSVNNKSLEKGNKQDNILSEGSSDSIDMKLLFPEDSNDSEVVIGKNNQSLKETAENEADEEAPEDFIPLKRSEGKTNLFENMDKSKDESILNVSGKKKKNKRQSFQTEETLAMNTPEDDNLGFFIDTTGTHTTENNVDANTSIKNSAKKNKQKNNVSFVNIEEAAIDDDSNDAPLEVSYRSEKNKSKQDLNLTQNNEITQEGSAAVSTPNESAKKKKKNKKGLNSSQSVAEISVIETTDEVAEKSINTSVTNEGSAKKKNKKLSNSQVTQETENETPAEPILNISLGSAKKQKPKSTAEKPAVEIENVNIDNEDVINQELVAKKRKRKSSANQTIDEIIIKDDVQLTKVESTIMTKNQKKKQKISNKDADIKTKVEDSIAGTEDQEKAPVENTKKKSKTLQNRKVQEIGEVATKKNKKRKERDDDDDDDASEISKVLKQNSFDKVHVPRLPANILKQLDDKPKKDIAEANPTKLISTSEFIVQEMKRRRNKPSNYLEESVYCVNDDTDEKKQKRSIKNPKVLPFIPTASTSDSGFTTNFRVNVIPQQTKFVAQSSDISNFKNDYLLKKRIKKLGTFEMYKRQRNIKIAKF